MDKVELESSHNHNISISDRKSISISGVKKIESFDNEEFLLETVMGYLLLKGMELEILKLDTYQGNVSIKGHVDSLIYLETSNKKNKTKEEGLFTRLFK